MENKPVRFRFRMSNNPPSPRQRQKFHGDDWGRSNYGPTSKRGRPGVDFSGGGGRPDVPVKFVRNPKHPKNMYTSEISIRQLIKGKPVKVTPGMSFPDPKDGKTIRNPKAPRFLHEFDPLEKDYDIIKNPLAVDAVGDTALIPDTADNTLMYDNDYEGTSDDSYEDDTGFSIIDDDTEIDFGGASDIDSALVRIREEDAMYSEIQREKKGQLVRVTPTMMEMDAPGFEPQPPPPRAPKAILVLPRAIVREDVSRHRLMEEAVKNRNYSNLGP